MVVLVTGANGYIGSVLVEKLKKKHKVIPLDINDWDIRNPSSNWSGVDCVVHLAALVKVGESVLKPWEYYDTNVTGTYNVVQQFSSSKLIFASTGAAFNPTSPYGMSKVMAEEVIKQYHSEYTIFRFYNVGGRTPRNPEGLHQSLLNACDTGKFTIFGSDYNTKDGTPVRDYVHVEDICNALVEAIEKPAALTDFEPLGSGKSYTVKEYLDAFIEVNGVLFDVDYGERRVGDLEKSEVPFLSKFMKPQRSLRDIVKI